MPSPGYERFDTAEPGKRAPETGAELDIYEHDDDDEVPGGCCAECIDQYNPKKDPVEFLSLLSLISLSIGILFTMIGYLVPREYEFDADLEAAKMEEIDMYYDHLSWNLDVCIIVGMTFVVLGGMILVGIIMYLHVTSDFWGALCGRVEPEWDAGHKSASPPPSHFPHSPHSSSKIRKHVPGYQATAPVSSSLVGGAGPVAPSAPLPHGVQETELTSQ